jgi:hypothetical protein
MKITTLFRISAFLPVLVLCGANVQPAHTRPIGPQHLHLTQVSLDIGNAGETETLFLITSMAQYQQVFDQEAVGIDFHRNWAFFYSAGFEPTDGYEALVVDAAYTADVSSLVITTTLVSPGTDCAVAQHVTKPYMLVSFPRPSGPGNVVRIQKDNETLECTRQQ